MSLISSQQICRIVRRSRTVARIHRRTSLAKRASAVLMVMLRSSASASSKQTANHTAAAHTCTARHRLQPSNMHSQIFRCRKKTSIISLGVKNNYVKLWKKIQRQRNRRAKTNTQCHRQNFLPTSEIQRHKRNPHDNRRVHGEADEFCFVKIFG